MGLKLKEAQTAAIALMHKFNTMTGTGLDKDYKGKRTSPEDRAFCITVVASQDLPLEKIAEIKQAAEIIVGRELKPDHDIEFIKQRQITFH